MRIRLVVNRVRPRLIRHGGDPLDGAPPACLGTGGEDQLFGTDRCPVEPQCLLAHQKCHPPVLKKAIGHTKGTGMVCGHLFHIPQQGAGFQQAAEIRICVLNNGFLNKKVGFHRAFPFRSMTKQAAQKLAQPALPGLYAKSSFLSTYYGFFCGPSARC